MLTYLGSRSRSHTYKHRLGVGNGCCFKWITKILHFICMGECELLFSFILSAVLCVSIVCFVWVFVDRQQSLFIELLNDILVHVRKKKKFKHTTYTKKSKHPVKTLTQLIQFPLISIEISIHYYNTLHTHIHISHIQHKIRIWDTFFFLSFYLDFEYCSIRFVVWSYNIGRVWINKKLSLISFSFFS